MILWDLIFDWALPIAILVWLTGLVILAVKEVYNNF